MTKPDNNVSVDDIDKAPDNLPAALRQEVPWDVHIKLRDQFSRLSTENVELQDQVAKLKRQVNTSQELDKLIEPFANKAFWFMCFYCGFVGLLLIINTILVVKGLKALSDSVLQILVGSTAATVIGLVGMVLTGIFVGARKG